MFIFRQNGNFVFFRERNAFVKTALSTDEAVTFD